jgi:hypothetical protein
MARMARNLHQDVDIFDINYWKHTADARGNVIKCLVLAIIVLAIGYIFLIQVGIAIDHKIDNQSTMLCNSALISGDKEWSENCQEYYRTGSVTYLRYIK